MLWVIGMSVFLCLVVIIVGAYLEKREPLEAEEPCCQSKTSNFVRGNCCQSRVVFPPVIVDNEEILFVIPNLKIADALTTPMSDIPVPELVVTPEIFAATGFQSDPVSTSNSEPVAEISQPFSYDPPADTSSNSSVPDTSSGYSSPDASSGYNSSDYSSSSYDNGSSCDNGSSGGGDW